MKRKPVTVVLCFDSGVLTGAAAAMRSAALSLGASSTLDLHCFIHGVTPSAQEALKAALPSNSSVQFHEVDVSPLLGLAPFYTSMGTYYRLLAFHSLSKIRDKAVYIDTDVVVNEDITELFDTSLDGKTLGMVKDPDGLPDYRRRTIGLPPGEYFNAGVLLVDLREWQEREYTLRTLWYLKANLGYAEAADQDAFNSILREDIRSLDGKWNRTSGEYGAIIHFVAAKKPWSRGCKHPERERFFQALSGTPWEAEARRQAAQITTKWGALKKTVRRFGMAPVPVLLVKINRALGDRTELRRALATLVGLSPHRLISWSRFAALDLRNRLSSTVASTRKRGFTAIYFCAREDVEMLEHSLRSLVVVPHLSKVILVLRGKGWEERLRARLRKAVPAAVSLEYLPQKGALRATLYVRLARRSDFTDWVLKVEPSVCFHSPAMFEHVLNAQSDFIGQKSEDTLLYPAFSFFHESCLFLRSDGLARLRRGSFLRSAVSAWMKSRSVALVHEDRLLTQVARSAGLALEAQTFLTHASRPFLLSPQDQKQRSPMALRLWSGISYEGDWELRASQRADEKRKKAS